MAAAAAAAAAASEWDAAPKLQVIPGSTAVSATFVINQEDHTLGNSLRYLLMRECVCRCVCRCCRRRARVCCGDAAAAAPRCPVPRSH